MAEDNADMFNKTLDLASHRKMFKEKAWSMASPYRFGVGLTNRSSRKLLSRNDSRVMSRKMVIPALKSYFWKYRPGFLMCVARSDIWVGYTRIPIPSATR